MTRPKKPTATRRLKRSHRGFAIYGEIKDTRKCVVRVTRSSAGGLPCCWIFVDDPMRVYREAPAPHLSRAQAKRVIAALQRFVDGEE